MGALVEPVPAMAPGGTGLVMSGMVAATGIRILAGVTFAANRNNLFIVAASLGFGMIPLIESGILLAAVALNAFLNGASGSVDEAQGAAMAADH